MSDLSFLPSGDATGRPHDDCPEQANCSRANDDGAYFLTDSSTFIAERRNMPRLVKLFAGNIEQQSSELVIDLRGASGIAWEATDPDANYSAHALCGSRQARIAGGTHEIQRNLIGERILGLPREAR